MEGVDSVTGNGAGAVGGVSVGNDVDVDEAGGSARDSTLSAGRVIGKVDEEQAD